MSESRAQFTYSPEGVLQFTSGLDEGLDFDDLAPENLNLIIRTKQDRQEQLDILGAESGIKVDESKGIANINIEVVQRFEHSFDNEGDPDILRFFMHLNRILPSYAEDLTDRVVNLNSITERGINGVINHQFQRWLNAHGVNETVARESALAMAIPFGADVQKKTKKDFHYFQDADLEYFDAFGSRLAVKPEKFGLIKYEDTDTLTLESTGEVTWRNMDISTLGDCACWGAAYADRQRIFLNNDTKAIYDMYTHNIDFARQSLSLILGVGALAYHASKYEGQEDILVDSEWDQPKFFPKITRP